ncbi:MAG TPA: ethanolamine ammonia-lyase subunit EutC [Stellaceae bacterium]|jgi:ethanolamine ammonia-lyase small subunit|nr:ethanolamine ammonia-lyase subunit EutC [Stellaceae bacterium]
MTQGTLTPWLTLRRATPARISLGRSGNALPTAAQLDFQLAHARARDAVHAALDAERIAAELKALGLEAVRLRSMASDRAAYLRRPDLGRRLQEASRALLIRHSVGLQPTGLSRGEGRNPGHHRPRRGSPHDIAFVIADGLSATAVNAHAVPLIAALLELYGANRPAIGPVAVAEGGRVAIGDEIGGLLDADLVAVLIGERPGLSAADSLGAYLTWAPAPGAVDAARNCISNIRPEGMPIADAAAALVHLIAGARQHRMTGVGLSQRLANAAITVRSYRLEHEQK